MKRLESPPSGHFMIVARVPVAPLTIRRPIVSETKPMLLINIGVHWQFHTSDEIIFYSIETVNI